MTRAVQDATRHALRSLMPLDLAAVLDVEHAACEYPWFEEEFRVFLARFGCGGLVVESQGKVVGWVLYQETPAGLVVPRLAVRPGHRRRGAGTVLLEALKRNAETCPGHCLAVEVREGDLGAQLFLRAQGFRAAAILEARYRDPEENAYLMLYLQPEVSRKRAG